jgi:hypothetical protein
MVAEFTCWFHTNEGSSLAQTVIRRLLTAEALTVSGSVHVEPVVDKVHWDQFISEFFGFFYQYHSTVALVCHTYRLGG